MSKIPTAASACPYVVGDDGLASWSDRHAEAWIGLLEAHKQLTRALDAELEAQHGLSLSALELLGLVERQTCPQDARAVEAHLTERGLSLARAAQATHFASVQLRFFEQLQPGELEVLAGVFGRLAPRAAAACTTSRAEAA
jgi:hypothetical protein